VLQFEGAAMPTRLENLFLSIPQTLRNSAAVLPFPVAIARCRHALLLMSVKVRRQPVHIRKCDRLPG
jgi:hypothetical protein